jgi:hypothetical protein
LKEDKNENFDNVSPQNVVRLIDSFIERILQSRKIFTITLYLSICSIIIAPVAAGLSLYLLQHPTFFALLEKENEFGLVLGGLLITVIIVCSLSFIVGIKQYISIRSWNKKYSIYSKKKDELDSHIVSEYGLDEDQSKT